MMGVVLSIVVPVYNVKPYLDKCMRSLCCQDLEKRDYEIILVDDGSTDGSGTLCDTYATTESNVVVIHQTNQGLSAARNSGMKVASGKYIQFVDSDDYLAGNVLGTLVQQMEEGCLDVLRFGFKRVKEGDDSFFEPYDRLERQNRDDVMDGPSFMVSRLWYSCYAWQFIIRRDLLEENVLYFKPGIIFEDTEWTPRVLQKARRVLSVDMVVYFYLLRSGSITSGASYEKKINSMLARMDDLKSQMQTVSDKRWYKGMISEMAVGIVTSVSLHFYKERGYYLKALREKQIYPLSSFLASKKAERKIRLINFSPRLACFLIHKMNM